MRIGVLEPKDFSFESIDRLECLGAVSRYGGGDIGEFLRPLNALFVRLAYHIDGQFLAMAPNLRWLCSPTTGHNHIDEAALAERRIRLISLRDERAFLETIRATPEHTFGLIIALLRRYAKAFPETLNGQWDRDACCGEELYGKSVGIIGLGRVGYRIASYCSAFGASVNWYDPAKVPHMPEWQRLTDVNSVIKSSHIVVLCANYHTGQQPIFGSTEIKNLGGRYFVNTARGELVDEPLLLTAIHGNQLAGVATDVIENENGTNRLAQWREVARGRNVIVTPHLAGATVASMAKTELFIAEKLIASVRGDN